MYNAMCDKLVEEIIEFATLVLFSRFLPSISWTRYRSAKLSALGQNVSPVACGDVLRRIISAVFCSRFSRKLADYFQSTGKMVLQYLAG